MHVDDRYPIAVAWSEEDRVWVADVPDLTYCTAHGDTPEEAVREAVIARTVWLRTAREEGITLPEPSLPGALARSG
jgi:predicted RNase H-like HicB family nuclease